MNHLKEKAHNPKLSFVIALDGPSASGKGLIGKMLAAKFNMQYVQSSIVYRGLAYLSIQNNFDVNDTQEIIKLSEKSDLLDLIKDVDLNQELIGNYASKISVLTVVRDNLNKHLSRMMKTESRIVMEGRDIGTVVAPYADLKIFITADVEARATRRYKQLQEQGKECILSEVLELLKERDLRDASREAAPLRASDDAFVIDTSYLSPDQVVSKIENYIG